MICAGYTYEHNFMRPMHRVSCSRAGAHHDQLRPHNTNLVWLQASFLYAVLLWLSFYIVQSFWPLMYPATCFVGGVRLVDRRTLWSLRNHDIAELEDARAQLTHAIHLLPVATIWYTPIGQISSNAPRCMDSGVLFLPCG
jgi:hypothetical protein